MTLFQDLIITDPTILGGKPVIKGTRVPVALIMEEIAGGIPIEEVIKQYKLDREQVLAALQYAAAVVREDVVFA